MAKAINRTPDFPENKENNEENMSYFNGQNTTYGPDGSVRVNLEHNSSSNNGNSSGNSGDHSSSGGPAGSPDLVLNNGQMGYWKEQLVAGAERDRVVKVFVPVGPSEAEKQAAADQLAQEKQNADAAAKAFADKTAAAAVLAEQQRQAAVNAAIAAGQYQSVAQVQNNLNAATQEAGTLKSAADNALSHAQSVRQAATDAAVAASQAEQVNNDLLQSIERKRPLGKSIIAKNGMLGYEESQLHETANHSYLRTVFVSIGISVAQRDNASADAVNKRNRANQLANEASAAEQASLQATANYNNAETRRQAAAAALKSAQEAEARAAEAERQRQAAEAAAAAAAEQKRLAEEAAKAAEAARIAAEQEKARQARQAAADKLKSVSVQSVRGIPVNASPAAFPLSWAVASAGGISLDAEVAAMTWSRIAGVLAELRGIAAGSMAGPVAAVVSGLLYSKGVGVGSDIVPGRDISTLMPSDALSLPDMATLNQAADNGSSVTMSVRGQMVVREDGTLETRLVRTAVAGSVPVVRAVLDKETGYWGYTLPAMPGVPAQTILISPSDAPGINGQLGLTGPVPLPEAIIHTGGQADVPAGVTVTVTPVSDDVDFNDLILVFPADSGLKPVYVMYRNPRNIPGTASGNGRKVGDNWLGDAGVGDGAPIPSQIADKLRGREFGSFDTFRKAFWKEVADDPELSKQFHPDDIKLMKKGYSPTVSAQDSVGKRVKIELHHKQQISKGGDVYNVDNLNALTPKRHIEIHKGE